MEGREEKGILLGMILGRAGGRIWRGRGGHSGSSGDSSSSSSSDLPFSDTLFNHLSLELKEVGHSSPQGRGDGRRGAS